MSTLFISDLHLSNHQPALTRLFLHFLQNQAREAEALYILGDLFESWIGDDNETSFNQQIAIALAELTAHGVKTYFMPGNRDFLIGQRFIEKTGCKLLADPTFITLYGIPTLLSHGDSWCTLDKYYMRFRRLTRSRFLQSLFLKLPLSLRQKIACYLRGNDQHTTSKAFSPSRDSTKHAALTGELTGGSINPKYDVVMDELVHCLQHYPAQIIIHGHTHQPCIQLFQLNKTFLKRIVLSDWHPSQGNILVVHPNKECELIYFT